MSGTSLFYALGSNPIIPFLKTPQQVINSFNVFKCKQGAATTMYAALAPEQSEGGKYFSGI